MLIDPSNNIIKSEIIEQAKANCQLSGMPDLKLGLNDKALYQVQGRNSNRAVKFNDVKFNKWVRLGKFENERQVTFIPPDGQFELMSYRLDINVKSLFSVNVIVQNSSQTMIRFLVKVKSNYKEKNTVNSVEIFVPIPEDVQSHQFKTTNGGCIYFPEQNSYKWTISQFFGLKQYVMNAKFKLPKIESPNRNKYKKQPINVKFQIPFFTISGFQIKAAIKHLHGQNI